MKDKQAVQIDTMNPKEVAEFITQISKGDILWTKAPCELWLERKINDWHNSEKNILEQKVKEQEVLLEACKAENKKLQEGREWVEFNLNNHVKVKLNDLGYKKWANFYNQPIINLRLSKDKLKTPEDYRKYVDKEGYVEFQGHEFMRVFGKDLGYGYGDAPFETTIFFKEGDR